MLALDQHRGGEGVGRSHSRAWHPDDLDLKMTDVPARLETLIEGLTALGSPIGQYLRPGRSITEVQAALGSLALVPSEELLDWFARHDGPDDEEFENADARASPLELFPGVRPLTLNDGVELCGQMRASAEELGEDARMFWRPSWFPILVGPGSTFAVGCDVQDSTGTAAIWRSVSHPGPSQTGIVAASLTDLLDRWIAEIRAGSVFWHADYRSLEPRDGEAVRLEAAGLY
jgi:hypothetical protein